MAQFVVPAAQFFKVKPSNIIVIHDELDLSFSTCRLKVGGGHAGHNGLRSIINLLGLEILFGCVWELVVRLTETSHALFKRVCSANRD